MFFSILCHYYKLTCSVPESYLLHDSELSNLTFVKLGFFISAPGEAHLSSDVAVWTNEMANK